MAQIRANSTSLTNIKIDISGVDFNKPVGKESAFKQLAGSWTSQKLVRDGDSPRQKYQVVLHTDTDAPDKSKSKVATAYSNIRLEEKQSRKSSRLSKTNSQQFRHKKVIK